MNTAYQYKDKLISREDRSKSETEISKRMEKHRIALTSIITNDDRLWDLTDNFTQKINIEIDRNYFKKLPRLIEYNGMSVTNYFARLENMLYASQNDDIRKAVNRINKIYDERDKLTGMNLRLVPSIIKSQFSSLIIPGSFGYVVNDGYLGLMEAAHKFDYKRGGMFSTYAVFYIRMMVMKSILNDLLISIPEGRSLELSQLRRDIRDIKAGSQMSISEISEELDIPIDELEKKLRSYSVRNISHLEDRIQNGDDDLQLIESIADPRSLKFVNDLTTHDLIKTIIKNTSEHNKDIMDRWLNQGYNQFEIARDMNLSRERVRQRVKKEGLRILKKLDIEKKRNGLYKSKTALGL